MYIYIHIYYILHHVYIYIIVPCVSFHGSPEKTGGKQRPRTDGAEAPETLEAGPWGVDGGKIGDSLLVKGKYVLILWENCGKIVGKWENMYSIMAYFPILMTY